MLSVLLALWFVGGAIGHVRRTWKLMKCYYSAKAAGKGYQKRLKDLWDLRNPDKTFRSKNNLSCQAHAILHSKLLSELELCEAQLFTSVSVDTAPTNDHDGNSDDTIMSASQSDFLQNSSPLIHDFMTITPHAVHDKNAPPLVHDVTITPPLIHDDSAVTPLDDVVITPPLIHDDMTVDNIHDTDNSLQVAISENSANDFDSLLTCIQECSRDENVPAELQPVFSQLCSCLSETGSLDISVRHALLRN